MTKKEKDRLLEIAKEYRGKRQSRYIDETEIEIMEKLDRKRSIAGQRIRVYAQDGFVANSYKWQALIDYVERDYIDGKKCFDICQTDAKRSHGNGALITVNNRAW